jgi:DNA-binding NarL/FixJ family response regulator
MPIRVLLVDDQQLVRAGFRLILETERDIEVVGEADDGRAGVELARRLRPDVVLMDIRMPEVDGVEATRLLAVGSTGPRVLILTTYDVDEYVVEALRAGASGFLLKDAPPQQLVDAIHVIAAGDALLAPSVTRRLLDRFARRLPSARPQAVEALRELTTREVEVMKLMATGMSNAEIAEALFVTEATVKSHISHIFDKLQLRDRVQAVVLAFEVGLVEPGMHLDEREVPSRLALTRRLDREFNPRSDDDAPMTKEPRG